MSGRILVFARNSFLARQVISALPAGACVPVSHDAVERTDLLDGIATVISFALSPDLRRDDYDLDGDPDVRLAQRIGERPIRHVMLSTRKVYAPSARPLSERDPLRPSDAYGRNKLRIEQRLRDLLGDRLTVLRLGNIFGYERGRRTFLGLALDRLAGEGAIHFDMSPFVVRDFLPVERAADILADIARDPPGGVLNVGSGIGLATGRLALWILKGYGRGHLVIESPGEHDPFVLDVGRLEARLGRILTLAELEASCRALGRRLAEETSP